MFKTYARICVEEDDEDEASAARLMGDAFSPAVPTAVVTSTGASRSRTQQGVQQRRAGAGATTIVTSTTISTHAAAGGPSAGPASATVGNLIDLGDEPPVEALRQKPNIINATSLSGQHRGGRSSRKSQAPAVELVTLIPPGDPFIDLTSVAAAAASGQQQQQLGRGTGPSGDAVAANSSTRQLQHPLDLLFGPEPSDDNGRGSSNAAVSTNGRTAAALPSFGSFSDLLRGFGAVASTTTAGGNGWPPAASAGPGPGPSPSAGSNAWGSFCTAPQPQPPSMAAASPGSGGGGGGGAIHGYSLFPRHPHSQSSNGIDDLLMAHRAMREAATNGTTAAAAAVGSFFPPSQPPTVPQVDRGASGGGIDDVFDPFGDAGGAAAGRQQQARSACSSANADGLPAAAAAGVSDASFVAGSGGGEGFMMNQRELLLYAVPLFKDRLVFLPVVNWTDEVDTSTVLGKVSAGVSSVQQNLSNMWHSLKDKGDFSAKIYKAGQAILENMNAEERLMKNIPKKANKLVVHHPASIPPDEIQDQLTQLTSSFCYKSVGKAAVAGVMLPVAVGLEVLAVPGIGWYTAYQLFKSTSAAAGGSRLNTYLRSDKSEVRICYAPSDKMDLYTLKARLSPDGVLGSEDIEDLCHDVKEPALLHPLQELRNRHLRRRQTTKADYALLPMSTPDVDEQYGSGPKKKD